MDLEDLAPLEFPLDALGKLILPDETKQLLVKAIQAVQTQTQYQQVPPAASKADHRLSITDRLFFLFHGGPGTGKSLTAQCLANFARRPLLFVTSGMKTDEASYADYLRDVFNYAKRWGCLVLMDHVDTVVECRSTNDFQRNAIVTGRL